MTNSSTYNETPQRAEGIPGCVFNGLIATASETDTFEGWIATLTRLAEEHERKARSAPDTKMRPVPGDTKPPLEKLAAGPWRSLGGYFDYSLWPDRERFLELDRAIAAGQELREPDMENSIGMV